MYERKVNKGKDRKKIKVLWFSNSADLVTGYGLVTRMVCSRLANFPEFEVVAVGENYIGPPREYRGFRLVGKSNPQESCIDLLKRWVKIYSPDVIITLEDLFTLANFNFHQTKFDVPWLAYTPLDGYAIPTSGNWVLRNCSKPIAMSKYTRKVLKDYGFDSELIYHGVDSTLFRPVVNNKEKELLKSKYGFKKSDVVCLVVARNSVRKRNQRLLEAFYLASEKNPNLKLFCHIMHYRARDLDLEDYVRIHLKLKYGKDKCAEGKIIFNKKAFNHNINVTDEEIAEYFKMSDMFVSSTSGEGFGLGIIQASSCGIPSIQTNYTTTEELLLEEEEGIGVRGIGVSCLSFDISSYNVEHALCNIEELRDGILKLSYNPTLRETMGQNGRKFVEKNCNWEKIAKQWAEIIKETII